MSKRISSGTGPEQPKLKRSDAILGSIASKPKVNKLPCSLCHQVVEELKYHYDICEPCHQKEEHESDMDVESTDDEVSINDHGRPLDSDLEDDDSDDVLSSQENDEHVLELHGNDVVKSRTKQ